MNQPLPEGTKVRILDGEHEGKITTVVHYLSKDMVFVNAQELGIPLAEGDQYSGVNEYSDDELEVLEHNGLPEVKS